MNVNSKAKLIVTLICMIVVIFAMFIAIWIAAKEYIFNKDSDITIEYFNVDAEIEMYIIGHDINKTQLGGTGESEVGKGYYLFSKPIHKEDNAGIIKLDQGGVLYWDSKEIAKNDGNMGDITIVLYIKNTSSTEYLSITPDFKQISSNSLAITYSEVSGLSTNSIERGTNNYKGMTFMGDLGQGAQPLGIEERYGLYPEECYVLRMQFSYAMWNSVSSSESLYNLSLNLKSDTTTSRVDPN